MSAYYNEIEPYAAQWLRNLIKERLIPNGEVDTRSIVDVSTDELRGFTQCHFFAGIGGWSYALRLAGWPDEKPIWTGSCPCQPFSVAGKGLGTDDARHLWPHFFRLIRAARPPVVMGEQVAGAAGYGWFDGVAADLESENYASRAVDVPACSVDAPHIRSRLYWVANDMADAGSSGVWSGRRWSFDGEAEDLQGQVREQWVRSNAGTDGNHRRGHMADATDSGQQEPISRLGSSSSATRGERCQQTDGLAGFSSARSTRHGGDMADAACRRNAGQDESPRIFSGSIERSTRHGNATFWSDHIWLTGADGKARRAQPGLPLLAHGVSARVGRLRAYGNAIVPQVAAEVIAAYMDVHDA